MDYAPPPPVHLCAPDAIERGHALLTLHFGDDSTAISVSDQVVRLPPAKALKGKGRFDVLEVWGHVYKAEYRMRMIYAQIPGQCVLMGQEVLEASDPY